MLRRHDHAGMADALAAVFARGGLVIEEIDVWFPPSAGEGAQLAFFLFLKFGKSLQLETGGFQVRLSSLSLSLEQGSVNAGFAGQVTVDGIAFDVSLTLPDMVLTGSFIDDEDALAAADDVDGLLGRLELERSDGTQLKGAGLTLAPRIDHYAVHASVANPAAFFGGKIAIRQVDFEAVYTGGLATAATGFAEMQVDVEIGRADPVAIGLSGTRGQDGWRFVGAAILSDGITLADMASGLGLPTRNVPGFLESTALTTLGAGYATASGATEIHAGLMLDRTALSLAYAGAGESSTLTGSLSLPDSGPDITLSYVSDSTGSLMVGTLDTGAGGLTVGALAKGLGAPEGFPDAAVSVTGASLVLGGDTGARRAVVSADLDLGLDLGALRDLPFVGGLLPADDTVGFSFRPLALLPSVQEWSQADWRRARDNLQSGGTLPDALPESPFIVGVDIRLGGGEHIKSELEAPSVAAPQSGSLSETPKSPKAAGPAPIELNKSLGPLHIDRVGISLDPAGLSASLSVDAALSLGGLTLGADGLALHVTRNGADTNFSASIDGFGLALSEPPFALSGGFLNHDGDFAGGVMVTGPSFSFRATGAMSMIDHAPSLFLYGALDYPIGGPGFFYVTGLAAGFGVNRNLRRPKIAEIRDFPLVQDVIGDTGADPAAGVERFHRFIAPEAGAHFLAAGVKFTSFKVIDGFVLFIVRMGSFVDLEVIGTATYQTPPAPAKGLPALARIILDVDGHLVPAEGTLTIEAEIDKASFIYSGLCHIEGGFAMAAWMKGERAGEFVLSVGGYHPNFDKPVDYPDPSRFRLGYVLPGGFNLDGSGYAALTSNAVMAGMSVTAHGTISSVDLHFHMGVDFLMCWEPYHYEGSAYVEVGAYWHGIGGTIGARVEFWGPEMAGVAHVDWWLHSFTAHFGPGERDHPPPRLPLQWDAFKMSFLPEEILTCRVAGGDPTVKANRKHLGRIAPGELSLTIGSAIPVTLADTPDQNVHKANATGLGVAPMDARVLTSELKVTIRREGAGADETGWDVQTDSQGFPAALWGDQMSPDANGDLIKALSSVTIGPPPAVLSPGWAELPVKVSNKELALGERQRAGVVFWRAPEDLTTVEDIITGDTAARIRSQFAAALGLAAGTGPSARRAARFARAKGVKRVRTKAFQGAQR